MTGDHIARNRAFWDADADAYQEVHGDDLAARPLAWGAWRRPESELQVLGDVAGQVMLELGCGGAQWAAALAAAGRDLRRARPLGIAAPPRGRAQRCRRRVPCRSCSRARRRVPFAREHVRHRVLRSRRDELRRSRTHRSRGRARAATRRPARVLRDASARVPHVERREGAADAQAADRLRRARPHGHGRGNRRLGGAAEPAGSSSCASTASTSRTCSSSARPRARPPRTTSSFRTSGRATGPPRRSGAPASADARRRPSSAYGTTWNEPVSSSKSASAPLDACTSR